MLGFWVSGSGVEAWTELTDTPSSITADRPVVGNSGGTALEFNANALGDYLRRDGSNTITGVITPDADATRDFGSSSAGFQQVFARRGDFVAGNATRSAGSSNSVIGGRNEGPGTNTMEMGAPAYPPVALFGNVYTYYANQTATMSLKGGGSMMVGSAFCFYGGNDTAEILCDANSFASFTGGYAYPRPGSSGVTTTIHNQGAGAFLWAYPAGNGTNKTHRAKINANGAGSFMNMRSIGSGDAFVDTYAPGTFTQGFIFASLATGIGRITNSAQCSGSFAQGYVLANGVGTALIQGGSRGAFAQGAVEGTGQIRGGTNSSTHRGAFAQGRALDANIDAQGHGALSHGFANGNNIVASADGAMAIGDSTNGAITASGVNAVQLGPGTNATAGSVQVGADIQIVATDSIRIRQNKELRFEDDGGNYVGFEAPALSANQIWILPIADGSDGDVLTTDGAGVLSWLSGASEKAWTFDSPAGTAGTFYFGGFYLFHTTSFTPAGGTNVGSANSAYAAHALVVLGAASTDMVVRVTGTSITDTGVRTAADSEDIDTSGGSTDDYYETGKKWIGQVSYTLQSGTGVTIDAGFSKYWDNNNTDFAVVGLEVTWLGGANDSAANIELLHHRLTGWTYSGGGGSPTPPTALAGMNADHVTENDIVNGEPGAWKRTNLSTNVAGSSSEGTIWRITTGSNKAFELGNLLMRITPQ